jgi:predicted nucleotide-binding protein
MTPSTLDLCLIHAPFYCTRSHHYFLFHILNHRNGVGRKQNHVFVVHGRNTELRQSIFTYLKALGLNPMEWDQAIAATGKGSPYIGEILDAAFAQASAIVVLATGDDEARLMKRFINPEDPKYEGDLTPQPRPNVLFEAGLAMGRNQTGTILVEVGNLRPWSDIAGRHVTHLNNSRHSREELANKLRIAGCDVDLSGTEWLTVGNFGDQPEKSTVEKIANTVEKRSQSPVSGGGEEYNFSGIGPATTKPFTISSSPWKLRYLGNWDGHFAVQVRGTRIELVVNRAVSAGKTYETYVHDQVGHLHFSVVDAPPDGTWTLLVLQPDD